MKRIIAQHPVILIADHDVLVRNLLRGVLHSAYDILVAADSNEALRLSRASRKKPIDLLLSDARMAGMDVPLLRNRILAERPQTKVLLMSSVITEPVDDAGQPLPFVQKPVELHTLRARIQELLDEPSVNRDRLKTILVVDDNLTRRERTGRILIRHRYAVLEKSAVYQNRRRIRGDRGKRLLRQRGELVERSFAHMYETGGMRRVHLRGHGNIIKRLLIHAGAFNLSLIMRKVLGRGTPRGFQGSPNALLILLQMLIRLLVSAAPRQSHQSPRQSHQSMNLVASPRIHSGGTGQVSGRLRCHGSRPLLHIFADRLP